MLATAGGCADEDVGTIAYERTGGFAGVHVEVHIDASGKMMRVDQRTGDSQTRDLTSTELADLRRKVDAAEFPTLEPVYECECADDFLHKITVDIDGTSYTVMTSGLASHPERLDPLIAQLSEMSLPLEAQN